MSTERAKSSSPDDGSDTESPTIEDQKAMEKAEEAKLKAKYPNFRPGVAGSAMLHKRLQRGPKYFDSGDYNMAKAKLNSKKPLAASEKQLLEESIGEAIPTPENLPRKPSLIQSKLASGALS